MISRAPILAPPASDRVVTELNGLRGIAITLVLLHHFWPEQGPLARLLPIANLGWIGVDLFFVISGTLITGILLDSKDRPAYYKNFYARRALRIFPLYYVFLAAVFALPLLREGLHGAFTAKSGSPAWYLAYLGNIPEALLHKDPPYFLAPVWSLAIEEQFYITFPLIVAALSRKRLTQVLVAIVIAAPMLRVVTAVVWPDYERVQYLFTFCRADVIALGGLLAIAVRDPRFAPSGRALDAALLVAGAVFAVVFAAGGLDRTSPFGRTFGYSVVALAFAALVVWTLAHRETARTAALRFAPLCYAGQICYGLYLLHRPADFVATRLAERLGFDLSPSSAFALKIVASFVVATASWYAFEKRILKLKSHFGRAPAIEPARALAATTTR